METESVAAVLAAAGAVLLPVGIFSKYIKKYASLPLAAILLGIIAGPHALNIIPPLKEVVSPSFVLEASRIALAIALIAIALKETPENLRKYWQSGTILLILGMLFMWAASSLVAYLILPLHFLFVILIGAIVTPTDPVVASSITSGERAEKHLPYYLRFLIGFESAFNDGLALLFVAIPIDLLKESSDKAWWHWATVVFFLGSAGRSLRRLGHRLCGCQNS